MGLPVEVTHELDAVTLEQARLALARAVPAALQDDRFSERWAADVLHGDDPFLAARTASGTAPVAFLGGPVSRGRLQVDALVEPSEEADEAEVLDALLRALLPVAPRTGADSVELWGRPAAPFHEAVARAHGMTEVRALHQLRCSLPVQADPLPSRPFEPGRDDEAVLEVNNRAFAAHPDQGGWTLAQLRSHFDEPWFDPDGLRLHERDGRVVGFCWTKVHREQGLGEIYVIGIHPDHHGQGLGAPMTAAGLRWLAERGLRTGMLYVEADNEPALRTYRRLGFEPVRTDRAWRLPLG